MLNSLTALVAFALWTLALVLGVVGYRTARFLGGAPINSWPRGAAPATDTGIAKRLQDAHANCVENLPVFASLVLAANLLGRGSWTDLPATVVFYARIGQSLAHLSGTGRPNVLVRVTFFVAQITAMVWIAVRILR